MPWTFGLTDLNGTPIGEIVNAYERNLSLGLNSLDTAKVRLRLDDPLTQEIVSRQGDVLLKVYQDSTLRFVGDLTQAEEYGGGIRRALDRSDIITQGYVLEAEGYRTKIDTAAVTARGLFEAVIPESYDNAALRQAWVDAQVAVKARPRQMVTFEPGSSESGLVCNFASPLWRLQKRLSGKQGTGETFSATPRAEIIEHLVETTDAEWGVGIVMGTLSALYTVTVADAWYFKPIAESITELAAVRLVPLEIPVSHTTRCTFTNPPYTAAAVIQGLALDAPTPQVWTTNSTNINAFQANGSGVAYRSAVSDTSTLNLNGLPNSRTEIAGTSTYTATLCSVDLYFDTIASYYMGMLVRYTDLSNFLAVLLNPSLGRLYVMMRTTAGGSASFTIDSYTLQGALSTNFYYTLMCQVDADGRYAVWFNNTSTTSPGDGLRIIGEHVNLASTGALPSGKVGMIDFNPTATAATRIYENFGASAPTVSLVPQDMNFQFVPEEPGSYGTNSDGSTKYKIATLNVVPSVGSVKPDVVFEPGKTLPTYGTAADQYVIGDTVTGRGKYSDGTARVNGLVRIHGMDLSIDENGKETTIPKTIPE